MPPSTDGNDAFVIGKMANAIETNTETLRQLVSTVDKQVEMSHRILSRIDKLDEEVADLKVRQRASINISMTGRTNEGEVRELFQFITALRQSQIERSSIINHAIRAAIVAVSLAAMTWIGASFKNSFINGVRAEISALQQTDSSASSIIGSVDSKEGEQ